MHVGRVRATPDSTVHDAAGRGGRTALCGADGFPARLRSAARMEPIFSVCVTIVAVHGIAVALLSPRSVGALPRFALVLCVVLGAPALVLWYARQGRVARVLSEGLVGLGAVVGGLATSVPHALSSGPGGSDYTGILATVAGTVLIYLAFRDGLRGRRLAIKLALGTVAGVVIAQWLIEPAVNVGLVTNAPRPAVAGAATLGLPGARDVSFASSDGVRLAGWYIPGRTGATVILLHGSHGTRTDTLAQLRMLVAAGYGVLAFDARGHGQSAGETNALGWNGAQDIAGAVGFLDRQPDADPQRIAAYGLSMGAEEALRAGANGVPLHAIIADGAGASTLADEQLLPHGVAPVFTSETWLAMRGTELISGETEPPGLNQIVSRIHVPVLLIASNAAGERSIDEIYRDRIGQNATLWHLPDASHTQGLRAYPLQYPAHVDTFLSGALRAP